MNDERKIPPQQFGARKEGLLWDYNFHYFDGLLAPSPDDDEKRRWVAEWLTHVPVGSRPAWDPYPASRRISNWIKWNLASSVDPPSGFRESLASQVRHLERTLEYHLMANHLLSNAVAVAMAGAFFGDVEGKHWLELGTALLEDELKEQFHEDGGHFELSPMYHSAILEDLLDLILVSRVTEVRIPALVESTANAATDWLAAVTRPDHRVPLFNDAAYDQGPAAESVLDQAAVIIDATPVDLEPGLKHLAASGYFRYKRGRLFLLGDVGQVGPEYQPGHAHCDMLSFELCWDGVPVVVDTGTSTYEVGLRRDVERGTAAHNTVQLGSLEQSEIWAGFRVARRARIDMLETGGGIVKARIVAFPRSWTRLGRAWRFDGESVELTDQVLQSPGVHQPTARLHFDPRVTLEGEGRQWLANGLAIRFEGATEVRNVEYLHAPEFNRLVPGRCLEIEFSKTLVTTITPLTGDK